MKRKKQNNKKIPLLLAPILSIACAIVVLVLEITNTTHFFRTSGVVRAPSQPITHIATTNNSNTSTGTKTISTQGALTQGSPTEENGQIPSNIPTNPSEWSTSSTGLIVVKLPTAHETLQAGSEVTGTAASSINTVQYRLTDNVVGVISEGPINVVNGVFTAKMNFKTSGTSGQLDVFSTDPTGRENNEVQIPVNF